MSDTRLPPEVRALVRHALGTVAHVDALLALRSAEPAACSSAELAESLALSSGELALRRCLDDLVDAGLVARIGDDAFRIAPSTGETRAAIEAVAAVHAERPGALARAIYARPIARARPEGRPPRAPRGLSAGLRAD